jgi:hypothetical protein
VQLRPAGTVVSRETGIGIVVTAVAIVAMAFDHLRGDDPGLEDPIAFVISSVLCLAAFAVVFGVVIPRTKAAEDPTERAGKRGLVCSLVAVPSIALLWLGLPWVIGGGGVALGLLGLSGERRRLAAAAIAIGAFVLVLTAIGSDWRSDS